MFVQKNIKGRIASKLHHNYYHRQKPIDTRLSSTYRVIKKHWSHA
jgi:hypothetical protein